MFKKKYAFANWKMSKLETDVTHFLSKFELLMRNDSSSHHIVLCPSHVHLGCVSPLAAQNQFKLGAQDCAFAEKGAYTGDVSAAMIREIGAEYVLIGHSERRHHHHETNHQINKKLQEAIKVNLCPVLCVGETAEDKKSNREMEVIHHQLSVLEGLNPDAIMIAYEPVWAIGTGLVPRVDEVDLMHTKIASIVKSYHIKPKAILYGGSVTSDNVSEFLALESVGGVLVGGASLDPDHFFKIVQAL